MICKGCGKEIPDGVKFCGYCGYVSFAPGAVCASCGVEMKGQFCAFCGAKAGDAPQKTSESGKKVRSGGSSRVRKEKSTPKKRQQTGSKSSRRRVLVILCIVLILGVVLGTSGAYYVAKNGWQAVPFAEKLTFLPFVKLDKEKSESYYDEPEEKVNIDEEKSPEREKFLPDPEEDDPVAAEVSSIIGDWIFESKRLTVFARFKEDGTVMLIVDAEDMDCVFTEGFCNPRAAGEFLLDFDGDLTRAVIIGETIKLGIDGATITLTEFAGEAAVFSGVWQVEDDFYINFTPSGQMLAGEVDQDGVEWTSVGDYQYNASAKTLEIDDSYDTVKIDMEILGRYAVLYDNGIEEGVIKYLGTYEDFMTKVPVFSPETDSDTIEADYILPDSNVRYLTSTDLIGLSKEHLRLARNEIYARHGRLFSSEDLQAYFNTKTWYRGTIQPEDFKDSLLNDYEKQNATLIKQREDQLS